MKKHPHLHIIFALLVGTLLAACANVEEDSNLIDESKFDLPPQGSGSLQSYTTCDFCAPRVDGATTHQTGLSVQATDRALQDHAKRIHIQTAAPSAQCPAIDYVHMFAYYGPAFAGNHGHFTQSYSHTQAQSVIGMVAGCGYTISMASGRRLDWNTSCTSSDYCLIWTEDGNAVTLNYNPATPPTPPPSPTPIDDQPAGACTGNFCPHQLVSLTPLTSALYGLRVNYLDMATEDFNYIRIQPAPGQAQCPIPSIPNLPFVGGNNAFPNIGAARSVDLGRAQIALSTDGFPSSCIFELTIEARKYQPSGNIITTGFSVPPLLFTVGMLLPPGGSQPNPTPTPTSTPAPACTNNLCAPEVVSIQPTQSSAEPYHLTYLDNSGTSYGLSESAFVFTIKTKTVTASCPNVTKTQVITPSISEASGTGGRTFNFSANLFSGLVAGCEYSVRGRARYDGNANGAIYSEFSNIVDFIYGSAPMGPGSCANGLCAPELNAMSGASSPYLYELDFIDHATAEEMFLVTFRTRTVSSACPAMTYVTQFSTLSTPGTGLQAVGFANGVFSSFTSGCVYDVQAKARRVVSGVPQDSPLSNVISFTYTPAPTPVCLNNLCAPQIESVLPTQSAAAPYRMTYEDRSGSGAGLSENAFLFTLKTKVVSAMCPSTTRGQLIPSVGTESTSMGTRMYDLSANLLSGLVAGCVYEVQGRARYDGNPAGPLYSAYSNIVDFTYGATVSVPMPCADGLCAPELTSMMPSSSISALYDLNFVDYATVEQLFLVTFRTKSVSSACPAIVRSSQFATLSGPGTGPQAHGFAAGVFSDFKDGCEYNVEAKARRVVSGVPQDSSVSNVISFVYLAPVVQGSCVNGNFCAPTIVSILPSGQAAYPYNVTFNDMSVGEDLFIFAFANEGAATNACPTINRTVLLASSSSDTTGIQVRGLRADTFNGFVHGCSYKVTVRAQAISPTVINSPVSPVYVLDY